MSTEHAIGAPDWVPRARRVIRDPGSERDPLWRPVALANDQIEMSEPGRDYGPSYADDLTAYYYWRR